MIPPESIVRIDRTDEVSLRARDAERTLFRGEGLNYREHDVDVQGLRVRVLEVGAGPPIVIIGGGMGDAWIFANLIRHFPGRRVLAVNRPGGGLSDGIDHRRVDLRELAVATLEAVYDHFGLSSAPVIAHGMGGLWTFWFAIEKPQRVPAMAQLGCPALILNTSAPLSMRKLSVPGLNRVLVEKMVPTSPEEARSMPLFLGHSSEVAGNWPLAASECASAFSSLPTIPVSWTSLMEVCLHPLGSKKRYRIGPDELRQVRAPVVFIWGRRDPFGGLDVAGQAVVMVPSAILHETEGGHIPWWDDARQCAEWIRAFFADVQGNASSAARPA